MNARQSVLLSGVLAAAAFTAVLNYRTRPPALPLVEAPPPPDAVTEEAPFAADLRPPRVDEVVSAVARVFPGAVPPDSIRAHRALSGDFNGDGSPDLAVPARMEAALVPAINGRFANWIVQDPGRLPPTGDVPDVEKARIVIGGDDTLLLVVHGFLGAGWRHRDARQGYVLKAALEGPVQVRPSKAIVERAARTGRTLPYLRGDLIYEPEAGRFLYWTGARYLWHGLTAAAGG
jgi:hypothetical protein